MAEKGARDEGIKEGMREWRAVELGVEDKTDPLEVLVKSLMGHAGRQADTRSRWSTEDVQVERRRNRRYDKVGQWPFREGLIFRTADQVFLFAPSNHIDPQI